MPPLNAGPEATRLAIMVCIAAAVLALGTVLLVGTVVNIFPSVRKRVWIPIGILPGVVSWTLFFFVADKHHLGLDFIYYVLIIPTVLFGFQVLPSFLGWSGQRDPRIARAFWIMAWSSLAASMSIPAWILLPLLWEILQ